MPTLFQTPEPLRTFPPPGNRGENGRLFVIERRCHFRPCHRDGLSLWRWQMLGRFHPLGLE